MEFIRRLLGLAAKPSVATKPMRHDMPKLGEGFDDIITGWRYCATLQPRTPLAILRQHNRVVPASAGGPPTISEEMWHGIWTPEVAGAYDFLGAGATMASDIGPIPQNGGDYLPYLIELRTISEGSLSVPSKEQALRALAQAKGPNGTAFSKFSSASDLVDTVLPRSLHLLPVPSNVRQELFTSGFRTLRDVQVAADQALLKIKGIGPKSVAATREFLATTCVDLDAERCLADQFSNAAERTQAHTSNQGA